MLMMRRDDQLIDIHFSKTRMWNYMFHFLTSLKDLCNSMASDAESKVSAGFIIKLSRLRSYSMKGLCKTIVY
jgi:hypothetical protein